MKYYTFEATIAEDGTCAQTTFVFDDYDSARSRYHEFMGYQIKAKIVKKAICLVISEQGVVSITDIWEKPVVPAESAEEGAE